MEFRVFELNSYIFLESRATLWILPLFPCRVPSLMILQLGTQWEVLTLSLNLEVAKVFPKYYLPVRTRPVLACVKLPGTLPQRTSQRKNISVSYLQSLLSHGD